VPRKRVKNTVQSAAERSARPRGETSSGNTRSLDEESAFPIVGIGASAGGLEAFVALFKALPADTGMAFVLVPHLAPTHASSLADILSRTTSMQVQEVADEPRVEPNRVYVIPPGREIVIAQGTLHLRARDPQTLHRSVDRFLRSLAEDQKHCAIGVVLSGTATDGTLGLSAIKAEGGITFAQDDTAQQTGMPHSAIAEGSVDFVLPPHEIARQLVRIARHPRLNPAEQGVHDISGDVRNVLHVVRQATGVDFTQYKANTLQRRITRRMMVRKTPRLTEYAELLRKTPTEVGALHHDLLIGVTTFFRNPKAFEQLKSKIFPRLVTRDRSRDPVRFWVLGCSTGQEAYSLAIAFTEYIETLDQRVPVQVFASDLNAAAIETARAGIYSKDIVQDVSPERLRRFFADVDGHYRIVKSIRDLCVFSQHNVLVDPPFSRIDLVSCRNLLMYLEPSLQQQVIPTLYYALKPSGTLWLGSAESIGSHRDLFDTEDARHKVFTKKAGATSLAPAFSLARPTSPEVAAPRSFETREGPDVAKEGERVLLARFAPAGVFVTPTMDIVQYRGEVGPYLSPAPGTASLNLLKMLANGLQVAVRAGILKAKKTETATREEAVEVRGADGRARSVIVEVIPIRAGAVGFWVLFEEPGAHRKVPRQTEVRRNGKAAGERSEQVARLSKELVDTREYLQSVIEQQEASHEELQSANEEVQSANEELQSINEELETSKEEIQSANEELSTVNDELQHRNAELSRTNNDLVNFLASTHQAVLFVGRDLRVRRYTLTAESLLSLMPSDIGRPIRDVRVKVAGPDLEAVVLTVLETLTASEHQVQDDKGRWFLLRVRPYRTLDNQIDGAVLVYVDVDAVTRARLYAESIIATVREPLVVLDTEGCVMTANAAFYRTFGGDPQRTEGARFSDLDGGEWDIPGLRQFLKDVSPLDHTFNDFELTREFKNVGRKVLLLNARRLVQVPDAPPLVLLAIDDVTQLRHAEGLRRQRVSELAAADQSKNEFLAMLAHELRNPLAPIRSAAQILGMPGIPAATSEKALVVIDRQVQMMTRLIEDLLDVARITQGKIELRKAPVDVTPLLRRAAELVQPHVDQRGQTLSFALPAEPCHVLGDGTRLEQAFGNLLHNASKFTRRSGHISVSAECPKADGEPAQVIVRVRDDGIGIPPEMLPGVFDLFKQAGASPAPFDRPGCRVGACPSHRHAARWGSDGRERGPESRQ
jgi:two-component system CheB/CheR fusion protein